MLTISLIVAVILAIIAIVHVYWSLGGRLGFLAAIPEVNGTRVFHPGTGITLLVAGLLIVAGVLILNQAGAVHMFPSAVSRTGTWVISIIFTGRAIGDFRYVGFLKRYRESRFARLDTYFYSPLALVLGVGTGVIAWGSG